MLSASESRPSHLTNRLTLQSSPHVTLGPQIEGQRREEALYDPSAFTTDNDPDMRAPPESPVTVASPKPLKPDITVVCKQCQIYVDLRSLHTHRYYHKALEIMKYKSKVKPESVEKLMLRRRALIKRLKAKTDSLHPLDPKHLQKINDAYEFLKSDLEDTFEAYRDVTENMAYEVNAVALNCSPECTYAVGMCSEQNNRWKNTNEDRKVYQDRFGGDSKKCFLAVYDGHHGHFAADMASTELHHALLMELEQFDPTTNIANNNEDFLELNSRAPSSRHSAISMHSRESTVMLEQIISNAREDELKMKDAKNVKNLTVQNERKAKREKESKKGKTPFHDKMADAFKRAHEYTDKLLEWGKDENSRVRWSGCSTLNCVIQDTGVREYIERENGNQETTSGRDTSEPKVFCAEPPKELGLIHLANAGNVKCMLVRGNKPYILSKDHTPNNPKEKARVEKCGGKVSEGMKDLRLNGILSATRGLGNHGDPALKKCVISDPHTTTVPIDQYAQFLVLASNGLWEVFSDHEVASLLTQMLPENHLKAPSTISSSIELLLANLREDVRSRIQSAASLSVASAHDLARRQKTEKLGYAPGAPSAALVRQTSTPSGDRMIPMGTAKLAPKHEIDRTSIRTDIHSEEGSHMGDLSDIDDDLDEDYEENDDDMGTYTEGITLPEYGFEAVITREEIQREFARAMAERLVQAALLAGAKDNITATVVLLPGCGL